MPWVKLDDHFFSHPKVLPLSKGAKLLYLSGLTYASAQLTDGHLSPSAVLLAARTVTVSPKLADELEASGLWERCQDGYAIHDYLTYNPAREKVLQARKVTAERVAGWREKKAGNATSNGVTDSFGNAARNGVSNAAPVPIPSRIDPQQASSPTEPRTPETGRGSKTSAIARARDLAVVNGTNGSPQAAILAAAKIAFGHVGGTETERRKQRSWAHELAEAGVTPDEFGALVAEYRRRGWVNPSLKSIAGNLDALRAPYEAGRRPSDRDEPRGFDGVREVFADVFDREGA